MNAAQELARLGEEVKRIRAELSVLKKQRMEAISVLSKMDRYVMENERLKRLLTANGIDWRDSASCSPSQSSPPAP